MKTNKKTTKRALFLSAVSMLLCVVMFVSTTYAWFTDSVTSANNIIKSGNLDIVLEYWDGAKWMDVEGSADILTGDLWEPGYVDVAYLRLKNAGSLALKYQLGVNIVSETPGTNKDEKTFKLSDYIYFDVKEGVDGENSPFADRKAAMAIATETAKISKGYSKAGSLEPNTDYVYLAMVVYMPTTVDNVANHNGKNIPEIDLGINVFATQLAYEKDSFDHQYDVKAIYADHYVYSNDELAAAIAAAKAGDVIALYAGNYNLPKNDDWNNGTRLADDLTFIGAEDGVKVTPVVKGSGVGEQGRIFANGYTFENLTFTNTVSPNGYGKFINCTFEGYNGLRHGAYKGDTQFIGCVFNNADGWAFHTEYLYGADVYFTNCRFNGLVEFTDTVAETNKVYFDNCAFTGTNRTASGKVFYAWKNNAVITDCAGYDAALFEGCTATGTAAYVATNDAAALATALNTEGNTVLLGAGNYGACPKIAAGTTVKGVDGTVFENPTGDALPRGLSGATVENVTLKGQNAVSWGSVNNADVHFKSCTFDAGFHIDSSADGKKVVFDDCTFTGKAYIKFGGNADYYLNNCTVEAISSELTSPWGREWLIVYGDITLTNCDLGRLVRAGAAINITLDSCTYNGAKVVDDSVVYKYQGVNYNNPTVTIK